MIFEVLVEIVQQREPSRAVIDDAAKRVDEERAFEVLIFRRVAVCSFLWETPSILRGRWP